MSCNHAKKIGYVSNQPDGYDNSRPLASQTICEREACIEAAKVWVRKMTGEKAEQRPFVKVPA